MTKKEILNNLGNTCCRIKPSKIDGVGVFAIKDIAKGTDPFCGSPKRKWHKIKPNDYIKLDGETKKMIEDFFVMDKNGTYSVPEYGLNGIDISFFLNTSENPNVKTTDDGTNFVALRDIKKNEELTVAYSTYDERYK